MRCVPFRSHVLETEPGDVIVFDEHVWHASMGGRNRRQWSATFVLDPATPAEERAVGRRRRACWRRLIQILHLFLAEDAPETPTVTPAEDDGRMQATTGQPTPIEEVRRQADVLGGLVAVSCLMRCRCLGWWGCRRRWGVSTVLLWRVSCSWRGGCRRPRSGRRRGAGRLPSSWPVGRVVRCGSSVRRSGPPRISGPARRSRLLSAAVSCPSHGWG